ncbi:MAG: hypothetical protein QOF20_3346, partial [Acidimicrobiaceae bacterium]|nr:hypothetical protein [Acidimicrobiaceae bacterium]
VSEGQVSEITMVHKQQSLERLEAA